MTTVDANFARMMVDLSKEWDKILDQYIPQLDHHAPFRLEVYTLDGLAARFMEEGIDFYPNEEA